MISGFSRLALVAAIAAFPVAALAGPCSDDIATLSRQLGGMSGLGAPVSEPAAGLDVGKQSAQAGGLGSTSSTSDRAQPGGASRTGGGSPGTVGGVSGTALGAKDAVASGQVATSDQDVRRQSVGKPTVAEEAASGKHVSTANDDRVSEAKMSLQHAIDLNARGDSSCAAAVNKTRSLMPKT